MEIPEQDETQPTPFHRESAGEDAGLSATVPTPVGQKGLERHDRSVTLPPADAPVPEENPDQGKTVAVFTRHAEVEQPASEGYRSQPLNQQTALDQTVPTPVHVEDELTDSVNGKPAPESGVGRLPPPPVGLPPKTARRSSSWGRWTLLGLLALLLIAVASAFAGYRSGINNRQRAEATQIASQIQGQYDLALQEIQDGQYNRAKQRLEYVIKQDPGYPGAADKLAVVLLSMNSTATPTIAPTPTVSPTPDLRGVDELFTAGQQLVMNSDWTKAIDTLLTLRKDDPNYQTVKVDDLLYLALRNRGRDKILKGADLEGGIYDLTLAEQFGPLDTDTKSYQTWAELYLRGASFWKLDWAQAVYYFAQVAPAMPNLRDGSGLTATERYRQSLAGYGDTYAKAEDWCNAQAQYEASLNIGTDDAVQAAYDDAAAKCAGETTDESSQPPAGNPTATSETAAAPSEAAPTEAATAPAPTAEQTQPAPAETPTPEAPAETPATPSP